METMFELKGFLLAVSITCFAIGNTQAQGGTVFKTIIKEGTGQLPRPNQTVIVHYTGTLESGVKIDSSYDRNEPFKFRLGAGEVIAGWDAGVSSMKVGERAKLEIAPEDGYGPEGMPGVIPPNATLIFDIELLAVEDTPGLQTAPFPDIHAAAGGFQSFGTGSTPAGRHQQEPTASLTFRQQEMSFPSAQPNQRSREPNIQNLVASNNAFISEPLSFPDQFSGVRPQGGQSIFGDSVFPTPGQNARGAAVTRNGISVQGLQNGFRSSPRQTPFQQPQPQSQTPPQPPVTFFRQVSSTQGGPARTFGPSGGQGGQFGVQGQSQFIPQPGMAATGTPQFRQPAGFGVNGGQGFQPDTARFGMGAPFPTGSIQQAGGRVSPSGTPDRSAMMATEERMLAARRTAGMPGATPARAFTGPMPVRGPAPMAEMLARARMGMTGVPANRIPPGMRALMAMRAGMGPGPGPVPLGFPRPRISPFMARRMFRRRRLI